MRATLMISAVTRVAMGFESSEDVRAEATRQSKHEIWKRVYGGLHDEFQDRARNMMLNGDHAAGQAYLDAADLLKSLDV